MVEMLLNRIANPNLPPQRITIPTEPVRRESIRAISGEPGEASADHLRRAVAPA
jgi:hypothetical protein